MATGNGSQSPIVDVTASITAAKAKIATGTKAENAAATYAFTLRDDMGPIPAGKKKYPDGTWLSVESQFDTAGLAALNGEEQRREVAAASFYGADIGHMVTGINWTIHKLAAKRPSTEDAWSESDALGLIADFIKLGKGPRSQYHGLGLGGDLSLSSKGRFEKFRAFKYPATPIVPTPATTTDGEDGDNVSVGDDKDGGTTNGRFRVFLQSAGWMVTDWANLAKAERLQVRQAAGLLMGLDVDDDVVEVDEDESEVVDANR
jgi:hypothetical protein